MLISIYCYHIINRRETSRGETSQRERSLGANRPALLAIPSRQEAKQRRRKNKSTKISVWFKVKEVLEKQQWEDHRVCSQSRN